MYFRRIPATCATAGSRLTYFSAIEVPAIRY